MFLDQKLKKSSELERSTLRYLCFFLFEWLSFQDKPKDQPTAQRKVISRLWSLRNDWWRSILELKNWKNQFNWIGLTWVITCFACRVTFISRQTCRKINQACKNKIPLPGFRSILVANQMAPISCERGWLVRRNDAAPYGSVIYCEYGEEKSFAQEFPRSL